MLLDQFPAIETVMYDDDDCRTRQGRRPRIRLPLQPRAAPTVPTLRVLAQVIDWEHVDICRHR